MTVMVTKAEAEADTLIGVKVMCESVDLCGVAVTKVCCHELPSDGCTAYDR